jgi:hypothetical protein
MPSGRLVIVLATIAFGIILAFGFTIAHSVPSVATQTSHATATGIVGPASGFPYD